MLLLAMSRNVELPPTPPANFFTAPMPRLSSFCLASTLSGITKSFMDILRRSRGRLRVVGAGSSQSSQTSGSACVTLAGDCLGSAATLATSTASIGSAGSTEAAGRGGTGVMGGCTIVVGLPMLMDAVERLCGTSLSSTGSLEGDPATGSNLCTTCACWMMATSDSNDDADEVDPNFHPPDSLRPCFLEKDVMRRNVV